MQYAVFLVEEAVSRIFPLTLFPTTAWAVKIPPLIPLIFRFKREVIENVSGRRQGNTDPLVVYG